MKQIEKVPFNSDVVNDNDHVCFPYRKEELFALARFPVYDNVPLQDTIRAAVRELNNEYVFPSLVFIPFVRYAEAVEEDTEDDILRGRSLSFTCKMLNLQMLVMTPDCWKDKICVTNL